MLEQVDLSQSLAKPEYDKELAPLRDRMFQVQHQIRQAGIPVMIVFEGWEASGKEGG